jgi:starch synthase
LSKQTLLGVAGAGVVTDYRGRRRGKWSPLYDALENHFRFAHLVQPPPTVRFGRFAGKIRGLLNHPESHTHRFQRWTQDVGRILDRFEEDYDLIFQLQTLFACGTDFRQRNYVIYADNSLALTLRHYPRGWPSANEFENRVSLELEAQVARSAIAVCTMSNWARRSMVEDYACDPSRVFVVGGGAPAATRITDGWDRQIALFAGLDFERKGGYVLLDAWPRVRRRLPQAELWIAGPPKKLSSQPGIRWLGRQAGAELASSRSVATVFVMPSLFEPWGFVFNEAMAAGLPCIGTTVCAMPEIITDGITGRLVNPADPHQLADALVELLGDPEKAETMGRRAMLDFETSGVWDKVAANIAGVLARVSRKAR